MQTSSWLTAIGFVALLSAPAQAAPRTVSQALSLSEREALLAGEVVARPMQFETDTGSYRGGVSYSLVNAPAAAVLSALSNADTLPQALPHTKSARLIDVRGALARVEPFGSGKSLVTVAAALDLGPGLTSLFFSDAVQRSLLSTPGRIRVYVEPRALALLETPGWTVGF